jgi:DNA processing protein
VVVELKPEVRSRLVEQCRNRMQISALDSPETSADGSASVRFGPMYGAAQAVLRVLQPDSPMALDHMIEAVEGSSPSEIIAILFELELAGMVRQLPGKNFIKVWAD